MWRIFELLHLPIAPRALHGRVFGRIAVVPLRRGIVFPRAIPTHWQLSFRVMFAEEDLSYRGAALLARIPAIHHCRNIIKPTRHIHAPAASEHHDGARIGCCHRTHQRILPPGQVEGAVMSLALCRRIKPDGNNDCVRFGSELLCLR